MSQLKALSSRIHGGGDLWMGKEVVWMHAEIDAVGNLGCCFIVLLVWLCVHRECLGYSQISR